MFIDYYQKIFKNNHYAYDICEWLLQFYPGLKTWLAHLKSMFPFYAPLNQGDPKKALLTWNLLILSSKTVDSNVNFIKKTPG